MATGSVTTSLRDGVFVVTIDNPHQCNALSMSVRSGLLTALRRAMDDAACRAIVLTGSERHFCAGGDITLMAAVTPLEMRRRLASLHDLLRIVLRGEKPVIAAVEGRAAGAGVALMAACDIVVASEGARFVCGFNRLGLVPDLGSAWLLPMRMGLGRAKTFVLSGRTMTASEAERAGLVDQLAPAGESLDAALALARDICRHAPLSNGFIKALMARMPRDLEEMLSAEIDAQAVLYASDDFVEGRTAFLAKRDPMFVGR